MNAFLCSQPYITKRSIMMISLVLTPKLIAQENLAKSYTRCYTVISHAALQVNYDLND